MKKMLVAAALILALALTACGDQAAPAETPAPTATAKPVPTATPEPEGKAATVLVNGLAAVYTSFKDGTELKITGETEDHYLVDYEGVTVLVEKRFVRLASDESFEPWDGYAKSDAPVYDNVYISGEALKKLPLNTKLTVLTELGSVLKAELEDKTVVYVSADMVGEYLAQYYGYGGGDYSGGGGGGGAAPADGGDIVLTSAELTADKPRIVLLTAQTPAYPISGTILADGVEGYLSILRRGDSVKVIGEENDMAVLLIDGRRCTVPAALVRMEGEKEFESWDGYAQSGATIYQSLRMIGGEAITMNTPVKVLEDLGDCFYVQWESGYGYMPKSLVSDAPVSWGYGDYSGGGGGSSGGGVEWTEPTM